MPLATRHGDMIAVHTQYRDRDLIRAVPGATYDNVETHAWLIPLSWSGCLTVRGLFRERLEIHESLAEWAWRHRTTFVEPALALRELIDGDGDPRLYPFQRGGVNFLSHACAQLASGEVPFIGKLLTDEMGLGKTVQAIHTLIAYARYGFNVFPALVTAPNNMKLGWKSHFEEWWPGVQVQVLDGGRAQRLKQIKRVASGEAHVLVTNWEALRGHSRLAPFGSIRLKRCVVCDKTLRGDPEVEKKHKQQACEWCQRELNDVDWVTIIADELHRAKEPKSKQTRALWALRTDKTLFRLGLTGTPIAEGPIDLWPALHFVDPVSWPTRSKYVDRWCLLSYNPFGGVTAVGIKPEVRDEFFAIVDPYVRRVPKSLVLPQLPKKVYVTRHAAMSPKQHSAYKAMEDGMVSYVFDEGDEIAGRVVAVDSLTKLTRLSQFASAYAMINDAGKVRLTDPSNKIDALLELLIELDGKPVVVFAESRQLIELAAARLAKSKIEHILIVGGQHSYEREHGIIRFQRGEVSVCLATIKAGGVGITLTRADTAIFLQRSWSMIDNQQAEDRVHRIGSERHDSITIIDIVAPGTVEEGQREALAGKYERLQEIVRDKDIIRRAVTEWTMIAA